MPGSLRPPLVGLIALALTACASTPVPMQMHLAVAEDPPIDRAPVWPGPPDVPRYQYVGQLQGENNFSPVEGEKGDGLNEFFAWLVGLGSEPESPRVLIRPQGVTTDAEGRIYVTDVGKQAVFVFDAVGGDLRIWTGPRFNLRFVSPIGIAVNDAGHVLVADADLGAVFELDAEGREVRVIGEGVLQRPTGLALDRASQTLYVADTRANDVKAFAADGLLIETIGNPGAGQGQLNGPTHLAWRNDRLYVADTLNARIQIFDRDGDNTRYVAERGLFVGNLTRPKGVAVDDEGNLYAVESYYDHLLVYNTDGDLLLPIGGTGAGIGQFYLPAGVWIDDTNRIYVADMFNGRVVVLQFLGG